MLRIEIDHVLRYVATGEDEALVLDGLRLQADGEALLGQVRAALELLGPAGLGAAAAERLRQVERAVEGTEPPGRQRGLAARRGAVPDLAASEPAPMARPMAEWMARTLSAASGDLANARPGKPTVPPGLAAAIRKGAAQAVRLGTAVLHKPFVKRDRGGPEPMVRAGGSGADLDSALDVLSAGFAEPAAEYQVRSVPEYDVEEDAAAERLSESASASLDADWSPPDDEGPILRSGARFDAPGGGTVELSCQTDAEGDRLRVALAGGRDAARPTLVTCIPAEGPITRATTDAAGTVVLPWPAPGAGVLRIDGHRTVEIALEVER